MRASQSSPGMLLTVLLALMLAAAGAWATTPQTIVIDGVNDFLPGNLVDADGGDTQYPTIDLGDIYATNDAVNLYFGLTHDQDTWSTVQLGIAIDVGTPAGGTTDPWGRAIEWSTATNKPDFIFYVNLDSNWQAGLRWDGAGWVNISPAGPGALGWTTSTGFREIGILLSTLGVGAGAVINWETWVTQDGDTKGPLDLSYDDASQLSTPGFTLFDTPVDIPLGLYHSYTVQAAADPDPPVVTGMMPTAYPIGNAFTLLFNEPIDPASVTNPATQFTVNQGIGVTGATVVGNEVLLTFDAVFTESAALYVTTATGVRDLAGNPIVEDGVQNAACLGVKNVVFRGQFGPFLGTQGPGPHAFSVEGGKAPLTFDPVCDTGIMVDTLVDDIWEYSTLMAYSGNCAAGTAQQTFEWKFNYNCGTWESFAGNRTHTLDIANGAEDILEFFWNDEDPSAFTTRDILVEFFVDMNLSSYLPGDVVAINGSTLPLNFNVPSDNLLVDDGSGNDATAGDGIFSIALTFPTGAKKDVNYKFLLNDEYECADQGDRNLFLNDEVFGDGNNGGPPLVLPVVQYDYCTNIWDDAQVTFSVDFNNTAWQNIRPTDVVTIAGTPNADDTFNWTVPSLNVLKDDGVAPDAVAGDKIYTIRISFPTGSQQNVEYKYLVNDVYECPSQGNRSFGIDLSGAKLVDQVLPTDVYQVCNITAVPAAPRLGLMLGQNTPNPFNPSTEISFTVTRGGQGSLRVYNLKGELVRTLREGLIPAGAHVAVWDGRNEAGLAAGSGVYFYRLEVGAESRTNRMVLLK